MMAIQAVTAEAEQFALMGSAEAQNVATAGNPWDDLIDEMDQIDDPFERMAYALYMLMPAILESKEEELDDRATGLEGLGELTTKVAEVHETFNSFEQFTLSQTGEAEVVVGELSTQLADLRDIVVKAKADDIIDETTEQQVLDAITEMEDWIAKYGTNYAAHRLINVWGSETVGFDDGGSLTTDQYADGKFWLDELNVVETSFKSVSGVAQTELQYDIGFYEVMIGSYKDMFQNYKGQVQSAVDGIKKS